MYNSGLLIEDNSLLNHNNRLWFMIHEIWFMVYLVHQLINEAVGLLTNLPLRVILGPVRQLRRICLYIYYRIIAISIECLIYLHTL
jgi:hypothetical protein